MTYFFIGLCFIVSVSFFLSVQDIKTQNVNIFVILAACIIIFMLRVAEFGFYRSIVYFIQGIEAAAFYCVVYFTSERKLGSGDIFFGAFSGICVWKVEYLFLTVIISVIFLYFFVIFMKLKKINLQKVRIPFIPFMSAGLIFTYVISYSL